MVNPFGKRGQLKDGMKVFLLYILNNLWYVVVELCPTERKGRAWGVLGDISAVDQ